MTRLRTIERQMTALRLALEGEVAQREHEAKVKAAGARRETRRNRRRAGEQ